jgi:DNA-binding CsgD family transcriptional regulator
VIDALDSPRARWIVAIVAGGAFAALLALEVTTEEDGVTWPELLLEVLELVLTIAAAAGVALLAGSFKRQHAEKLALLRDLDNARRNGDEWRQRAQSHVEGLGAAIRKQLQQWKLTEAESDVSMLILKGFSHKEIAQLRGTSEATVRQQARVAYDKAGVKGRSPFCAFFLEDLLPAAPDVTDGAVPPHAAEHVLAASGDPRASMN